ncbi:predicted protein [Naegleria gruberi]|uniref:Predicted protein n=1 Tax=Naegleria gruberi TaxID=5762 RepID=D2W468_NAEGR|nr:uncharacterized protein NAEGRDRAFT_54559 [Naegleria gruberi]EFC36121.1 predicted protein [Naegleria gruberi]|eukprot:XP_002668865.1 predicted protein [Naegleria gruberi strain NEG-M]
MARQYYNSNSSNDSGSGDDMMYMTDDEDMFREINSMEDYFSQSQETNTSPGQSDQNYEDIKWEDDPNEDFHGFTTQSDSANVFLCDEWLVVLNQEVDPPLVILSFLKKDEKAPKEKENEEKAKNPLSNQSHASFFANFKPSTMVTLNTNQLPENVRQVSKVTQAQQKPTEDSTSTAEDELAETLSKLNINNTALTTKFDPKKITFTLEKKGSKEVYDLTNPSKEKKSIPSFNPGDVIQFSVKNNNEKEFIEKTNLIVGTTIPIRSIVTFSDKSTGFTQMKETVATSQIVQIPNIRVTNPTCKKKAKIVTIVLFVKFIESGKERIFTTKRRIMVVNK